MRPRRLRRAGAVLLLLSLPFILPMPALADNCGDLADCWDTLQIIAIVIAAVVVVCMLVVLFGEFLPLAFEEAAAASEWELAWARMVAEAAEEAAAETAQSPFPWIDALNMGEGATNCGDLSLAVDEALGEGGLPSYVSSLGEPGPLANLEEAAGSEFLNSSYEGIGNTLATEGPGSRGIVYITDGNTGHVFNAVNHDGAIWFLDGQTGLASQNPATLAQASSWADWAISNVKFMLTWPPV